MSCKCEGERSIYRISTGEVYCSDCSEPVVGTEGRPIVHCWKCGKLFQVPKYQQHELPYPIVPLTPVRTEEMGWHCAECEGTRRIMQTIFGVELWQWYYNAEGAPEAYPNPKPLESASLHEDPYSWEKYELREEDYSWEPRLLGIDPD